VSKEPRTAFIVARTWINCRDVTIKSADEAPMEPNGALKGSAMALKVSLRALLAAVKAVFAPKMGFRGQKGADSLSKMG
jgi:hypothetical protein